MSALSELYMARMCYPVRTLGRGDRIGIWTTGCNADCYRCISPEFKKKEYGKKVPIETILRQIRRIQNVEGFVISGGEPFLQPEALDELVQGIRTINEDIIVFTGYLYEDLMAGSDVHIHRILDNISLLIDGPYVDALNDGKGLRGSSNQRIIRLNSRVEYGDLENQKRKLQLMSFDQKIIEIGIP